MVSGSLHTPITLSSLPPKVLVLLQDGKGRVLAPCRGQLSLRSLYLVVSIAPISTLQPRGSQNRHLLGSLVALCSSRGCARREDLWPVVHQGEEVSVDRG